METHHLEARPLDLVLSQHREHEAALSDLQGKEMPFPARGGGPVDHNRPLRWLKECCWLIEVPLSRRRRDLLNPVGREAEAGGRGCGGVMRCKQVRSPRQREKTSPD